MIITCPECSTHYTVDAKTLGQSGREVRCASCSHKWFATPEDETPPAPEPDAATDDPPAETTEDADTDFDEIKAETDAAPEPEAENGEPDQPAAEDGQATGAEDAPQPTPAHRKFRDKLEAKTKRKRLFVALGAWGGIAAGLLLILSIATLNRVGVVKILPKTAGAFAAIGMPVNIWGVNLKDITSERVNEAGDDILRISGQIFNPGKKPRAAPLVRISLRDETDAEIHAWTVAVDQAELPPKTGAQFSTMVKNLPPSAVDLRFSLTDTPLGSAQPPKEHALNNNEHH